MDPLDQVDRQLTRRKPPDVVWGHVYFAAQCAQRLIARRRGEVPCIAAHDGGWCGLCGAQL